jgi:2-keto-4-pentenoate hydratase
VIEPIDAAARRLWDARRLRNCCAPVRDLLGSADQERAYRVQESILNRLDQAGTRRVGRKIGLTSDAIQRQMGVTSPNYGVLLRDMAVPDRSVIDAGRLMQPRVEGEVAFELGADLDGELIELEDVRRAISRVRPAIEVADSRIRDWDISAIDTIADNASAGLFVLGPARALALADLEGLADSAMELTLNGEVCSSGTGRACLGHPVAALFWLACSVREAGRPLVAGEVVLTGALGPMVTVEAGDSITVSITGLGSVSTEIV